MSLYQHHINELLVVIMILIKHWFNRHPSQLGPGVELSYDILTPASQNDLVLLACYIYLV